MLMPFFLRPASARPAKLLTLTRSMSATSDPPFDPPSSRSPSPVPAPAAATPSSPPPPAATAAAHASEASASSLIERRPSLPDPPAEDTEGQSQSQTKEHSPSASSSSAQPQPRPHPQPLSLSPSSLHAPLASSPTRTHAHTLPPAAPLDLPEPIPALSPTRPTNLTTTITHATPSPLRRPSHKPSHSLSSFNLNLFSSSPDLHPTESESGSSGASPPRNGGPQLADRLSTAFGRLLGPRSAQRMLSDAEIEEEARRERDRTRAEAERILRGEREEDHPLPPPPQNGILPRSALQPHPHPAEEALRCLQARFEHLERWSVGRIHALEHRVRALEASAAAAASSPSLAALLPSPPPPAATSILPDPTRLSPTLHSFPRTASSPTSSTSPSPDLAAAAGGNRARFPQRTLSTPTPVVPPVGGLGINTKVAGHGNGVKDKVERATSPIGGHPKAMSAGLRARAQTFLRDDGK